MERARLLELFDAYLDTCLTEDQRAALSAELRESPVACRLFWEYAHQHALLADLLAEARGLELAEQEQHAYGPLTPRPTARAPRDRRWRWAIAVALALLLAAGVGWLLRPGGDRAATDGPALARLGDLRGQVHVLAGDVPSPGRSGQVLRPGEEVQTGDDSSAVVTYPDDSRLELNADTAVRLMAETAAPGKRVFLVRGVLNARVTKQPKGRPLRFSTDEADMIIPGTRFSAAGILGETRIEMEEGRALLARRGDVKSIEVSTGTYAVGSPDMELFNPATRVPASGKPFAKLKEGSGPVLALAPLADDLLAVGCWNGLVKLWDTKADVVRGTLDAGKVRVHAMAATPDGRSLAVGYESAPKRTPALSVWDLPRGDLANAEQRWVVPCMNKVSAVSFLPDAATLAMIGGDGRQRGVLLWDLSDRRERLQMGDRLARADCLAVAPGGRYVAAGYRDGKVRIWDALTGRVDRVLEGHRREVQSVAFAPAGDVLASGSRDGTVRLWSMDTGEELRSLTGTFNEVRCLTFSPDGRTLATGHAGVAILWSVMTGEKRSTLKAHQFAITALVYLDEGRTLASAGWDRTVKLWELEPVIEQ